MRVVHIEDFFHPDAGYQLNVLAKYQAHAGHEVFIITSELEKIPDELTGFFGTDDIEAKDRKFEKDYGVVIKRLPIFCFYSGRSIYKPGLTKIIDQIDPDMLFIHGGDGTIASLVFIPKFKKKKYAMIFDSHMLKMAAVNPLSGMFEFFYRLLYTPKVIKEKMIIIRTQDDDYLSRYLGIPLEQAPYISHATDQMLFKPDIKKRNQIRKKYGLTENDFVVLYAGKIIESKGADLLARVACSQYKSLNDRRIVFLIIGKTTGEFGKIIEEAFAASENRIIRVPTQTYSNLAKYYCAADLAVFPKQCSLSFFDVQACGLPVVEEDNNINLERLSHDNGLCFKGDDPNDFREKIQLFLDMPTEQYKEYCSNAIQYISENFSYDDIYLKYEKVINDEWNRQKKI